MAPPGTEKMAETVASEHDLPPAGPLEPGPSAGSESPQLSALGLFACALALLVPLAYSPALGSRVWAPKAALVLLFAGVGLPLLVRDRSLAGRAAAAFLGVAIISTLFSTNPVMSLLGMWGQGSGLIFVGSVVGAWCLGRRLTEADRRALEKVLLTAIFINAVIALLQMTTSLTAFDLQLVFGRSTGLLGGPVYLGGMMGAGFLLAAYSLRGWPQAATLAVFAGAGAVAQGRVTLLLAVLGPLFVWRRWGVRAAVVAAVAIASGWSGGTALTLSSQVEGAPGERSADRAVTVAADTYTAREGFGPRVATWGLAGRAVANRPIVGSGPGRFWAATVPYRTLFLARHSPTQYYTDAHNFVAEYATTTGVLGLLTLGTWLLFAARRAAGPLAVFAFGLLVHHLLQPQSVALTPIALLALGAAAPLAAKPSLIWERAALAAGALAATAVGSLFLFGQYSIRQAYLELDPLHSDRSLALLPWPEAAHRSYIVAAHEALAEDDPDWSPARRHLHEAVSRDSQDPRPWAELGDFELARGRGEAAERAYRRVIARDPWNVFGIEGMANVGRFRQDRAMVDEWEARLERITGED